MKLLKPKFKEKYIIKKVGSQGVFLLSETSNHLFEGEHLMRIVPLINGKNKWQEIIDLAKPYQTEEETLAAINILNQGGHLVDQLHLLPPSLEIFWNELGKSSQEAIHLVRNTNIHIKYIGNVHPAPFEQALRYFGFKMDTKSKPSLIIVLTDDYLHEEIGLVNKDCYTRKIPWLITKPIGLKPMIGPFVFPDRTPCWNCLKSRLIHNREIENFIERKNKDYGPFPLSKVRIPITQDQVVSQTIIQLIRWISAGHHPFLESGLLAIDILGMGQLLHKVAKIPQCKICGNPEIEKVAGKPLVLNSQIGYNLDGNSYRSVSPDQTFAKYANHISKITGVVSDLNPVTDPNVGPLKVFSAGQNLALKKDDFIFLKNGLRNLSAGKGKTESQAKTSALCEALERFSGLYRSGENKIKSRFVDLKTKAIHLYQLLNFSTKQYKKSNKTNSKKNHFNQVPNQFDDQSLISWTPVWSMTNKCQKFIPTSLLYYGFEEKNIPNFGWADSNGNAAGSTLEDAILQGFLEIIERDSVAIWWYNKIQRKEVNLEKLNDKYINELINYYRSHDRELYVLDITSDTGIPVYAAISRRINHKNEDIVMGFGAHLNSKIAINRAVTELNQFSPAVLQRESNGDTKYFANDTASLSWWKNAKLENQIHLVPRKGKPLPRTAPPECASNDLKIILEKCFEIVESMGHEVLILNQTRPDVGLPVVKVIIPGFRHWWERLGKGRLYDVPVKMGWLKKANKEKDMNPIPMFI